MVFMEFDNTKSKSNSHGSLNNTNQAQSSSNHNHTAPSHSALQRPALRGIQSNATLLRSPGPLESMLKTTTETGDIGPFTITPTVPSATYHQPCRPRLGLADANLLQETRSRLQDDAFRYDDRRKLPSSSRDTTSEIISLYGSDAHYSRTFTPSNDEGQRSYSLTTCSSHKIPSQKSSATLQSQSSGPAFQRSRSPYPVRLRRPRNQHASTAVTENPSRAYSQTAEIDRSLYRTAYGSHNTIPSHVPRRPPPLSLRRDTNRSTASLPSRTSPRPYQKTSAYYQASAPRSLRSGRPEATEVSSRVSDKFDLRLGSLTSIIEMYRPVVTTQEDLYVQSTGTFFYDYSEDLVDHILPVEPIIPLCPVPKRIGSFSRPMVLRADEQGSFDIDGADISFNFGTANMNEFQGHFPQSVQSNNPLQLERKEVNASMGKPRAYEDIDGDSEDNSSNEINESVCQESNDPPAQSFKYTVSTTTQEPSSAINKGAASVSTSGAAPGGGTTQLEQKKRRYALEGIGTQTPPTAKSTLAKKKVNKGMVDEHQHPADWKDVARSQQIQDTTGTDKQPSQQALKNLREEAKPFQKRHRRNPATLKISTTTLEEPLEDAAQSQIPREPAELTQNLVSQKHELRTQNIASHRTKALPPLPIETDGYISDSTEDPFAEMGHTEEEVQTNPFETQPVEEGCDKLVGHATRRRSGLQKLKLRVKASASLPKRLVDDPSEASDSENTSLLGRTNSPLPHRKLKLKVPRTPLSAAQTCDDGTRTRSQLFQQHESPFGLDQSAQKNIRTFERSRHEGSPNGSTSKLIIGGSDIPKSSPQPSDQFDIPYPTLSYETDTGAQNTSGSDKDSLRHAQSLSSAVNRTGYRRLRQKISFNWMRNTDTHGAQRFDRKGNSLPPKLRQPGGSPLPPRGQRCDLISEDDRILKQPDKQRGRMKRWARGAKRVVRFCLKKTLDRPTSSNLARVNANV